MSKLKVLLKALAPAALILAVCLFCFSIKNYIQLPKESDLQDKGVFTFTPRRVILGSKKRHQSSKRLSNRERYKTIYKLQYRSKEGYEYIIKISDEKSGKKIIEEAMPLKLRVITSSRTDTYMTIPENESIKSALIRSKLILLAVFSLSGAYIILYAKALYNGYRRKKEGVLSDNNLKCNIANPKYKM